MLSVVSTQTLADYLVRDKILTQETATTALTLTRNQNISFAIHLVKSGLATSTTILNCAAKHSGLPIFNLKKYNHEWLSNSVISVELIDRYKIVPLNQDQDFLLLGITDPTDHAMIATIGFHTGLPLKLMLVDAEQLDELINTHCRPSILYSHIASALSQFAQVAERSPPADLDEHDDEPIIEFVDHLLTDAINKKISDIHIEPHAQDCRIRFRCDGLLYEAARIPALLANRICTRIKILAQLNIAERRLPQDGRIHTQQGERTDIRVNTCPSIFGEKIVLRLLDARKTNLSVYALGLNKQQLELLLTAITQPQGLILVTGPTGSGKTTTLYAVLNYLNQIERNISTVEDPVEIELAGITQVNINPKIGLDFATILRTLLRQDPDVIMVGEIRDTETAKMAMQAAQTGHLVLSTLHTNSANDTVMRLQALGVDAYSIKNSITLVLAQRLLRKLCNACKQREMMAHGCGYRAIGCDACYRGYVGRVGIFEVMGIEGSIWESGMTTVQAGITSYAELLRVIGRPPESRKA